MSLYRSVQLSIKNLAIYTGVIRLRKVYNLYIHMKMRGKARGCKSSWVLSIPILDQRVLTGCGTNTLLTMDTEEVHQRYLLGETPHVACTDIYMARKCYTTAGMAASIAFCVGQTNLYNPYGFLSYVPYNNSNRRKPNTGHWV